MRFRVALHTDAMITESIGEKMGWMGRYACRDICELVRKIRKKRGKKRARGEGDKKKRKMDWTKMLNTHTHTHIYRRLEERKINKRGGKINGGENSGSTTLILRGKVGRTVGLFQRRGQKEIVSAPFLTVRS